MQASSIPTKFPIPFASSAAPGFIRTVPETSSDPNAASLTLGFPPNTFVPEGAGGVAPNGEDFNGILNQITQWCQWQSAGGPISYDATFSAAIGGYPKGTVLASATLGGFWLSTVDNNTTNPDSGGAGWAQIGTQAQATNYAQDTGTTNAYACTLTPPVLARSAGMPIRVKIANTNTGPSTLNVGPGAAPIVRRDGSALIGGELVATSVCEFIDDGVNYRYSVISPASNAITAAGTDTQSAVTPASLMSLFGNSLGSSGYQKFPGGFIVQWGTVSISAFGTSAVTFPIAFPNNCFGVQMNLNGLTLSTSEGWSAGNVTKTGFSAANGYNNTDTYFWFAYGN